MQRVRKAIYVLCAALICGLSGCTAALTPIEPASPDNPPTGVTSQKGGEDTAGSNAYDAGAQRTWSVPLTSAPSFVGYLPNSKTLIVAIDGIGALRGAQVLAYSVVSEDNVLEQWSTDLPDANSVTALAVNSDAVFVNTTNDSGQTDLLALDAKSGRVTMQWSASNSLDSDVPQIVGATEQGVGVVKAGSSRLTLAIVDSHGEVSADKALEANAGSIPQVSRGLVNTGIPAKSTSFEAAEFIAPTATQFVAYPSLAVLVGDDCVSTADGYVCVARASNNARTSVKAGDDVGENTDGDARNTGDGDNDDRADKGHSSTSDTDKSGADTDEGMSDKNAALVMEYDANGHIVRQTKANHESVAANVRLLDVNASATTRSVGDILAAAYSSASDTASKNSEQTSDTHAVNTDGELPAAILYDGVLLEQSDWAMPEGAHEDSAKILLGQVPFYQLPSGQIVSAHTGTTLTASGSIGYAGVDTAVSMIFEYAQGVLYYLEPTSSHV